MEIKKPAVAGTLESSDCQIVIRPNGGEGIEIELESDVAVMFGDSIRETVNNTLEEFGVKDATWRSATRALSTVSSRQEWNVSSAAARRKNTTGQRRMRDNG